MPRYTFKLADNDGGVEDRAGVMLPNDDIAYQYGCDVVRELMAGRELTTRHWHLEVYENDPNGERLFEIPFACLDQTLDHLSPDWRELLEHNARRVRSLRDVFYEATLTRLEAKSLVARSRNKPYLAADRGRKVIRENGPSAS